MRRRGKICTYTSLVLAFLGFGGVLLYFTLACPDLAAQATEISRLAWLILIIWAAVFGLGLLVALFVCCDLTMRGRMRIVVMFTDKESSFDKEGDAAGAAAPYKPNMAQRFGGARPEDAGRLSRHGDDFDRVGWGPPRGPPRPPPGAVGYQEPLVGPRGHPPPGGYPPPGCHMPPPGAHMPPPGAHMPPPGAHMPPPGAHMQPGGHMPPPQCAAMERGMSMHGPGMGPGR